MFSRVGGATLALIAAASLALSIVGGFGPVPGWWSGHPSVRRAEQSADQSRIIKAKAVDVGLLTTRGCNTGGDEHCESLEVQGMFETTRYGAVGVTALLALVAVLLALCAALQSEARKTLAKIAVFAAVVAGVVAIALIVLGPDIKSVAPNGTVLVVVVPLGIGTYLFAGGMMATIGASVLALQPAPARKPRPRRPSIPAPPISAPQPPVDALALMQQEAPGAFGYSPAPGPSDAQYPAYGSSPMDAYGNSQLRPLYDAAPDQGGTGGFVPSPPPVAGFPFTPQPGDLYDAMPGAMTDAVPGVMPGAMHGFPAAVPGVMPGAMHEFPAAVPMPPPMAEVPITELPSPIAGVPALPPLPLVNPPPLPPPRPLGALPGMPPALPPPRKHPTSRPPPLPGVAARSANLAAAPPPGSEAAPPHRPSPPELPRPSGPIDRGLEGRGLEGRGSDGSAPRLLETAPGLPPPVAPTPSLILPAPQPAPTIPSRPTISIAIPPPPSAVPVVPFPAPGSVPVAPRTDTDPVAPAFEVSTTEAQAFSDGPATESSTQRAPDDDGDNDDVIPPPAATSGPAPAPVREPVDVEAATVPASSARLPPKFAPIPEPKPREDRLARGLRAFGIKPTARDETGMFQVNDAARAPTAAPAPAAKAAPSARSAAAAAYRTEPVPTLAQPPAEPEAKVPVSTAPDSLPPPTEKQAATSGPSPACPQCEAPMAWVEAHLRFFCRACKMYF